jgi:hypothetical protein
MGGLDSHSASREHFEDALPERRGGTYIVAKPNTRIRHTADQPTGSRTSINVAGCLLHALREVA